MKISPADRDSAVWQRLRAYYSERLALLRVMNDGDNAEIATARLRGRIAEIKHLLDMEADDAHVTAQPADGMQSMSFANE